MNALWLLGLFDAIYAVALVAWVGSILFFSFGVAPIVFKVLAPEPAARFVRALFPRYYAWGATWCTIALGAFVCGPLAVPELRGGRVAAQEGVLVACILVLLYCGNALVPATNAAREAGPEGEARFKQLHKRSVALNGLVLLAGLGLIVAFALRPAPRSHGIIEPTPIERVRREIEAQAERAKSADDSQKASPAQAPKAGQRP